MLLLMPFPEYTSNTISAFTVTALYFLLLPLLLLLQYYDVTVTAITVAIAATLIESTHSLSTSACHTASNKTSSVFIHYRCSIFL